MASCNNTQCSAVTYGTRQKKQRFNYRSVSFSETVFRRRAVPFPFISVSSLRLVPHELHSRNTGLTQTTPTKSARSPLPNARAIIDALAGERLNATTQDIQN